MTQTAFGHFCGKNFCTQNFPDVPEVYTGLQNQIVVQVGEPLRTQFLVEAPYFFFGSPTGYCTSDWPSQVWCYTRGAGFQAYNQFLVAPEVGSPIFSQYGVFIEGGFGGLNQIIFNMPMLQDLYVQFLEVVDLSSGLQNEMEWTSFEGKILNQYVLTVPTEDEGLNQFEQQRIKRLGAQYMMPAVFMNPLFSQIFIDIPNFFIGSPNGYCTDDWPSQVWCYTQTIGWKSHLQFNTEIINSNALQNAYLGKLTFNNRGLNEIHTGIDKSKILGNGVYIVNSENGVMGDVLEMGNQFRVFSVNSLHCEFKVRSV